MPCFSGMISHFWEAGWPDAERVRFVAWEATILLHLSFILASTKSQRRASIMKKNLTELVMILDRSGSMGGLESDTIGG